MLLARKSLLVLLITLALLGCQRAVATPTAAPPSPTATEVPPTRTPLPLVNPTTETQPQYTVAPQVPRIAADELNALLSGARNVVVIDTRGPDAYEAAHIRGAINIPYEQIEMVAPQLSRTAKLVFYCA